MSDKAKQLLDEWIAAEKEIDKQRADIINLLQKKINQIQRQRNEARQAVKDSVKLYIQFRDKNDNTTSNIHP